MLSSVAALLFPALLLLLLHPASAQLYGCKTVNCPVDDKGLSVCPLGNSTFEYIGIANVASSISSSPLTWTVGVERSDTSSSGQIPFDRNFYLGTPPSLNVEGKTGCALFFDGVAPALARQPNVPKDAFTCKDVLEERCIADVIAQAKESYRALVDAGDSEVTFCGQLRDALVEQPPSTCDVVTGSWGDVIAKGMFLLSVSFVCLQPGLILHSSDGVRRRPTHQRSGMPGHDWQRLRPHARVQHPQGS